MDKSSLPPGNPQLGLRKIDLVVAEPNHAHRPVEAFLLSAIERHHGLKRRNFGSLACRALVEVQAVGVRHPNLNPLFLVGQHLERIAISNRDGCYLKRIRYADTGQQHSMSERVHQAASRQGS